MKKRKNYKIIWYQDWRGNKWKHEEEYLERENALVRLDELVNMRGLKEVRFIDRKATN